MKRVFVSNYAPANSSKAETATVSANSHRVFKKLKVIAPTDPIRSYLKDYPRAAENVDPLQWWRNHEAAFPELAKMARDYLAIPGTSTASERSFSGGDRKSVV